MKPRPRTRRLLLSIVAAGATVGPACSNQVLTGSVYDAGSPDAGSPDASGEDGFNGSMAYPTEAGENGCLNGSCSYPETGPGPDVLNPSDGPTGEAPADDVAVMPHPDGHAD